MGKMPAWFGQLESHWSKPVHVADLNRDRAVIPVDPGCYAFTIHDRALRKGNVLYVGEAKNGLRRRVPCYLSAIKLLQPLPDGRSRPFHKGRAFVLSARKRLGDQAVYVRWVTYFAGPQEVHSLEASLIEFLEPHCNDRDESLRTFVLDDDERLVPNAL